MGDAAGPIIDQAARNGALIVMATHGRSGLAGRWALGSVVERDVRGGTTPLLLIRSIATSDAAAKSVGSYHF